MTGGVKSLAVRRTSKDYSLSFKLQVVQEVESGEVRTEELMRKYGIQGHSTILRWCKKYGNFDYENRQKERFMQSPQQRIRELEQRLRLLERQNKFLTEQLQEAEDKAAILDRIIDIAEADMNVPIRKKRLPEQSEATPKIIVKR